MLGLDYSSGRPRGSEVARLGYRFVIRYCGQPGNAKNATRAEVDDMIANGVAVALVFESTAARAGQGFDAGAADARTAAAHQAALGIPASRPIYYAVDYDADPVAVEPYFRGLNSVPGTDSAYGSFRVVQRLRNDGLTVDSWQTVAWSRGQIDAGRDVFQRLGYVSVDGIQCDVNEALTADFGQYPASQEDDMLIFGRTLDNPTVYVSNGLMRQRLKDQDHVNRMAAAFGLDPSNVKFVEDIDALGAPVYEALADDEAVILEAIRGLPTGGQVDAAALAAELAAVGGLLTMQQFVDILNKVGLHVEP